MDTRPSIWAKGKSLSQTAYHICSYTELTQHTTCGFEPYACKSSMKERF